MSDPDETETSISLHLDQEDRRYRGGSNVTGRVVIQAPRPEQCTGIDVRLWRDAYGEQDKTDMTFLEAEQSLHGEGTLSGSHELPFSLPVPYQTPSHDGKTVWIVWCVTARVRSSTETRAHTRQEITVVPARVPKFLAHHGVEAGPYRQAGAGLQDHDPLWKSDNLEQLKERLGDDLPLTDEVLLLERSMRRQGVWDKVGNAASVVLIALLGLVAAAIFIIAGARGIEVMFQERSIGAGLFWLAGAAILGGLFPYGVYKLFKRTFKRLRHGAIRLQFLEPPWIAACGEVPEFSLRILTTRKRPMEKISWEMRYFEEAAREEQRTHKSEKYTHIAWETKAVVADKGQLDVPDPDAASTPGAVLRWKARIGATGPSSLVTEHRRILWETRVWVTSLGDAFDEHCDFLVLPLNRT